MGLAATSPEPHRIEMQTATIGTALGDGIHDLESAGIDEARLLAAHLLAHIVDCRRLELPLAVTRSLAAADRARYRHGIGRLAANEPLQYVMGCTEFCGHIVQTDARALIPRPETELLVERALDLPGDKLRVVDVGTGSGCIAVSLALARPDWDLTAVDTSSLALELAAENAARLGAVGIRFAQGDILDGLPAGETFDAIVANLPYVPDDECDRLAPRVRGHEPRIALAGGADGLAIVRRLVTAACARLTGRGTILLEIGAGQGASVEKWLVQEGYEHVEVRQDVAGCDRIVAAIWGERVGAGDSAA